MQGIFMACTNNVIWRIITGRRTQQDDPELKDLTERIDKTFQNLDPGNPLALMQMNSLTLMRLFQKLGLPNFHDATQKIKEMLVREIESTTPEEGGNYIERALHEGNVDKDSVFRKIDGKATLLSQLIELFFGGIVNL